jgi:predicted MPP superfamily phosphohydrolase
VGSGIFLFLLWCASGVLLPEKTARVPTPAYHASCAGSLPDHEYYWREKASLAFHRLAGFRILRQDATRIAPAVVLAGVDDGAGRYTSQTCLDDENAALDLAPRDSFVILLKHQPLVRKKSIDRFDLQLSGHIHGGQIFPFQLVIHFLYPYASSMHRFGSRSLLNVSRGVGTWGPPMRLRAQPEICLITLEPAAK